MRISGISRLPLAAGLCLAAAALSANAQSLVMSTPRDSQRSTVSQRIALTDITISYHRPRVGGRKVWGGIVPYGQVWRAGANENTTIEFSDPVQIEGQPLAKGVYGLHMIPAANSATIIFSKNSTSWGSFSYKQDEDALRVTVKPHPAEMHEALTYEFTDVQPDSTTVTLLWEKMAVPFRVAVGSPEVTLSHIREQLRNSAQYTWMGWDDAASYCLNAKINYDEALKWADRSIQAEERFENLQTKSQILEALNRKSDATAAMTRAMSIGNAQQVYVYGRQLQAQKKSAEAMEVFRTVAKRFPEHWLGHLAQARLYSAAGDFANASKEVRTIQGMASVPEPQKPNLANLLKRLENKEDINS